MTERVDRKVTRPALSSKKAATQDSKTDDCRTWKSRTVRIAAVVAGFALLGMKLSAGAAYVVYWGLNGQKLVDHVPHGITVLDLLGVVALLFGLRHALESIRAILAEIGRLCRVAVQALQRLDAWLLHIVHRLGL